jgi:putative nucleotidyltransferase with HDIG domain
LEELTPDLIITDVEMPVMDGVTFCRKVRSRPQTAEVPLIILSSRVDHKTIAAGFEAGADEYLTKPFYQDELLNKVEPYLAPAPTRRQEHVLLVSTGFNVTHQLKTALSKQGLVAAACRSPEEALIRAMKDRPDMIMAEEDLPGESGYQLCSRLREDPIQRKVPFILITDKVDGAARKMGDKVGVSAYLSKPFTRERVVMLAERLLAEQRSLTALEWDMILASIMSLAKALDERDPYTRFHSENVAKYALAIGRRAGMNAKELENLRLAGLLHDLGKIGIPDKVLHKPGRLTDEEFGQIKEHCQRGAEILKPITSLENIIPAILHHHERIDGGGYPSGLSSDQIPYMARILATADTYDALVTDRPYRRGMPREQALSILKEVAGTQLDAEYVRIFIKWVKDAGDAAA